MKSKRMLATLLLSSLLTSMTLVGCGGNNKNSATAANAESGGMDKEQYMNALFEEPKTLDPAKSSDNAASLLTTQYMEGLTRVEKKEDGVEKVVAAGAEKWETSEDGLTWTFHLRDNFNWSDGKPVVASDFEYGVKRTIKAETASPYAFLLYTIKNAEKINKGEAKLEELGVRALDNKTLEITLEKPCPYFLNLTYFKVMHPQRQDIVEKYGERYGSEANTLIFNGPFKLTEWRHNDTVILEKNEDYWDKDSVNLNKITFRCIKEISPIMNELMNGTIDLCGVSMQEWIKKFDEMGTFNVLKDFDGSTTYSLFNTTDKYMKNAKIRKAYMLAMDREGAAETLYKGLSEPAYAWCPPLVNLGDQEFRNQSDDWIIKLKEENKDPKELLKEGLKEEGLDTDPSKHTFRYLESNTNSEGKAFADYIQDNISRVLGVNVVTEQVDYATFQKRTDEMDYQIGGMSWRGDYNDPTTFFEIFMSDANVVHSGWKNEKYDELIAKAKETTDPAERAKCFKEAEKILIYDEAVISPLAYRRRNTYAAKYVQDLMYPTFGVTDYKYAYTSGRK